MSAKAEYQTAVSKELLTKMPGHAVPRLLKAHRDLVDLGFRAHVHPRATAGAIALRDAEESLKRRGRH